MITSFNFNEKNSWNDFKFAIESVVIQPPSKIKVKENVPGMNSFYDFSTVASGGEQVFNTREITVKGFFEGVTREQLYKAYTRVQEWLLGIGQSPLIFSFDAQYYYLAEIESAPTWSEFIVAGELEIKFIAEPYKYGVNNYGDLLWDDIDFELPDYIQVTHFNISGTKNVTLYIPGSHSIVPSVITSSDMQCTLNGFTTAFTVNKSTDCGFRLRPGENNITIKGVGNIQFNFRKEVL